MSFNAEKAASHRIIMLVGDETFLRDRALESILAAGGVAKDDFDLEYFDAGVGNAQEWLASVGTAPFLSERRTVVVRHMLRSDPETVRKQQLTSLPESARLILFFDDELKQDDRQAAVSKVVNGWKKLINSSVGAVFEFKADPKAAASLLKESATANQKTISPGAIEALLEMSGGSASHALSEFEKIVIYVGKDTRISESDVRAVVVPSRDWNVFKMIDSIVASQPSEALRQLRILVGSAQKAEDAAFSRILPMIGRQLRLLWQGRTCVEARCQPAAAPDEILRQFPEKPNLAKEQPFRQSAVMNAARRISFSQLTVCLGILNDTDIRLKGSLPSFSAMDSLERMVLDMCGAIRK